MNPQQNQDNIRYQSGALLFAGLLALVTFSLGNSPVYAQESPERDHHPIEARLKATEAYLYGMQAYVYGFPLVIMDVTKDVSTGVTVAGTSKAPVNQFANMLTCPDASFKDVVRANVDTLYSSAWLDLGHEPLVLSVPDTKGRYYLMPMLDMWTNVFASPGKRTTGTQAGDFLIVGPNWHGSAPADIKQTYRSPTRFAWLIGRTQANGPDDYPAVNGLQKGYKITPLSNWGKPATTPVAGPVAADVDTKTSPIEQVEHMDAGTYFKRLAILLKDSPPAPVDAPMLRKLKDLGIEAGKDFDISKVDPAIAEGLNRAAKETLPRIEAGVKKAGRLQNGWSVLPSNLGRYGKDYNTRAGVALMGLGANRPDDAMYPTAFRDGDDRLLDGANKYVLHLEKGQTPPTNAFWSLTMYNAQSFFVPNPINRLHLAFWMPLKYEADGSLDLYIQSKSPAAEKEANWLPSPESGQFSITMRDYWPKKSMLDGTYEIPAIRRVEP